MKLSAAHIDTKDSRMKLLVLSYGNESESRPGILWIHGGGYSTGMAEMVFFSCGKMLAKRFGGVVISPEYRLSGKAAYPAALEDCYAALEYLFDHAEELRVDRRRIIVGGESAGGGLAAAVCLYARDRGKICPAMQIPLYPMIDCEDTDSSRDNHGKVWNTKRNRRGWAAYLGELYGTDRVPVYASAAREKDFTGMPPCYTFVCEGEPFYRETLNYTEALKNAGVKASCDVYTGDVHSFDLLLPFLKKSRQARKKLCTVFEETVIRSAFLR